MIAASWTRLFFHWPDGGVWSNLVASAIWTTPTLLFAWRKLRAWRQHVHDRLDDLHEHQRRMHEHLLDIHDRLVQ